MTDQSTLDATTEKVATQIAHDNYVALNSALGREAEQMRRNELLVEQVLQLGGTPAQNWQRPQVGAPLAGGFFVGVVKILHQQYALIVSPKQSGELKGAWNSSGEKVEGAEFCYDGLANTRAMASAGSELAKAALALDINGFADWYIPSRDELELIYRNLKPTSDENDELFRDGDNASSVPVGYPYTATQPGQTAATEFRHGGAEALEAAWYWSSTQYAPLPSNAWVQDFDDGGQNYYLKGYQGRARAVRRLPI